MENKIMKTSMLSNNKGSLLIISYFMIVILITLGAAFVAMSTNEARSAERQRRKTLTINVAEAGIEEALYYLRKDFADATGTPSWQTDGDIGGLDVSAWGTPSPTGSYLDFLSGTMNGVTYDVDLQFSASDDEEVQIRSVGTLGDEVETIRVIAQIDNVSPWNNAIFAGEGNIATNSMINGNVNVRGSVHILGTSLDSTDVVLDLGGTAEIVGNNYDGLDSALEKRVPALAQVDVNGEMSETLNAELRVKVGLTSLDGSATVGESDNPGDGEKELVDGIFSDDGFTGSGGTGQVYSDNGWSNGYDLGDSVSFPALDEDIGGGVTYQDYIESQSYVVTDLADLAQLAAIDPNSSFTIGDATNYIRMLPGTKTIEIQGNIYIGDNITPADFNLDVAPGEKSITYTGKGALLVTGNVLINTDLVTPAPVNDPPLPGDETFPTNVMGIMTPNNMSIGNSAQMDVMGAFYAEGTISTNKQTDIIGTIVSNYFNFAGQVPSIYQVPALADNLPDIMVGQANVWLMRVVAWQKI